MKPGSLVMNLRDSRVGVLVHVSSRSVFDGDHMCVVLWSNSQTTNKVMSSSLKVVTP